jgi:sugar lactone lactonase YvrE
LSIGTLPSGHTYTAFTAPQSFAVTAKDGAGNIIVGTYTAPITLRNSDTTGATTIATAGSDTATLDYGGQAVVSATISAAAANASGASAIFTPGPALPPDIYVSDSLNKTVSQILAAGGYTTVNTLCSGFNYPDGLALDATGNIFLADQYTGSTGTIKQMVAPNYTTINTLVNRLNYPEMVAVDASDNVFFSVTNAGVVYEAMAPTYTTLNPIGSGFSGPAGVALDASDNLFVTDSFNNTVYEV